MDTKQTFEKLGYIQVRNDHDYIIYEKIIDNGENKKEVIFCEQLRNFQVKYDIEINTPSIDINLFKAITMQLTELGWI